ncbi:ferritin heavy chain-like [Sorex araneus]|uniref:ferritin heavy chain-like n=1 Tax=Sorex araneus TaxID=42254 RepID=UPI002433DBBB|nr:ferritin heavy chain-like [Sorex araneus]
MACSQFPHGYVGRPLGCERAVNRQIHLDLYASYCYLAMEHYFDRPDVALEHFANFFHRLSQKERKQAMVLMELQNKRTVDICFWDILKPGHENKWENGLKAMEYALSLETRVYESLLDLYRLAHQLRDLYLCNFLQTHCLNVQSKYVKELSNHVANLCKMVNMVTDLDQYRFDNLDDTKKE